MHNVTVMFGVVLFVVMGLFILFTLVTINKRVQENVLKLIAPLLTISMTMMLLTYFYTTKEGLLDFSTSGFAVEIQFLFTVLALSLISIMVYISGYMASRMVVSMMTPGVKIKKIRSIDYALAPITMIIVNHIVYFNFFI